ncbi:hypothetical protein [Streptomyces sp. NPDC007905]|uniref:hypothetical protein n=1 Tax=Streptomyces sp. NPDC007905 TaxID=3364788 RepID=UPI0036E118A2
MTENDILLGIGLTVALAVGCRILASRRRIPPLILLLPAGFAAGAPTDVVDPEKLLGPAFSPWSRCRWRSSSTTPGWDRTCATEAVPATAADGDVLVLLGPAPASDADPAG